MGQKKIRPITPGMRGQVSGDFKEITKSKPEKSLLQSKIHLVEESTRVELLPGIVVVGIKDNIPAKVAAIEYDPNRNARIALLHYVDGEKAYIIAPDGITPGAQVVSGPKADIKDGNCLPLRNIPAGTFVHNVELRPAGGAKMARSAGSSVQLMSKEGGLALLRLPSGEMRTVSMDCRATIGTVGNAEAELTKLGKAGRKRWKGVRPQTRGVAMNPVDHPLGGGEGKSSGGRTPVSPWGKPEKKTRNKKKYSNKSIVRGRSQKGRG